MKVAKYHNKRYAYGTKIACVLIFILYSFSKFGHLKAQKDLFQKIFNIYCTEKTLTTIFLSFCAKVLSHPIEKTVL